MTVLTLDHPAWHTDPDGQPVRLIEHHGAPWLARWEADGLHLDPQHGSTDVEAPTPCRTPAVDLPSSSQSGALTAQLAQLGCVERLATPCLWDAITTAVLRQVVRAAQARKIYRSWSAKHGRSLDTPSGCLTLAPSAETVLALSDEQFAEAGTTFHRTALRAAAAAYLERGHEWAKLAPTDLAKALEEVQRIGPWTASAAAADYTGDFSVYPHGDLAVRTWARRAAPDFPLPEADRAFAAHWQQLAEHDRTQLHALTLFTLTWGIHAQTDQHPHPD